MNEKLDTLLDRLINKTESGELRWKEGVRKNTYQLSFPDYSVIIEATSKMASPFLMPSFFLRVLDPSGEVAVSVTNEHRTLLGMPPQSEALDTADTAKLTRLFEVARASIGRHKNKAVEDLLARLA